MDDIIKTFHFQSENVELLLHIKKKLFKGRIKMFIDGELDSKNEDLYIIQSTNGTSNDTELHYRNKIVFWISSNAWKGLRWNSYKNETKFSTYNTLTEMKEKYLLQLEFITPISECFYDSIKDYKRIKLLYETQINEIVSE